MPRKKKLTEVVKSQPGFVPPANVSMMAYGKAVCLVGKYAVKSAYKMALMDAYGDESKITKDMVIRELAAELGRILGTIALSAHDIIDETK